VKQDQAVVNTLSKKTGSSYVQSQQSLPNVIVVGPSTGATGK
jgi:hypothetical protein